MWHADCVGLWLRDRSAGTKSHPFQPDSDMHRMGLAHTVHICSLCSVPLARWCDTRTQDMAPTAKDNLTLQAMYWDIHLSLSSFKSLSQASPCFLEGLLCLRGVSWQSRKQKLLEARSGALLAFVRAWIDETFLGVLDTRGEGSLQGQQERSRHSPPDQEADGCVEFLHLIRSQELGSQPQQRFWALAFPGGSAG